MTPAHEKRIEISVASADEEMGAAVSVKSKDDIVPGLQKAKDQLLKMVQADLSCLKTIGQPNGLTFTVNCPEDCGLELRQECSLWQFDDAAQSVFNEFTKHLESGCKYPDLAPQPEKPQ